MGESKLMSTVDIFDMIKTKHQLPSDNQLAIKLGCDPSLISKHRSQKDAVIAISHDTAMKCATLLDMPPEVILMCVHAERAKCAEEKQAFENLYGLAMAHSRDLRMHKLN